MAKRAAPVFGIFDSGVGGLTVAEAIHKKFPGVPMIYFGDTAHLPYGDKSPDSIKYYAIRIAQFLLDKGCNILVIACNTASSVAFETVKDFVGNKARVFNVIDPVVDHVCKLKNIKKAGVIGTKGTIRSDVYAKKIKAVNAKMEVASLATPLLAPMIEEGFFNNNISKTVIRSYLGRPKLSKIDLLILACTHYPLIQREIDSIYQGKVHVLNSAEIVAMALKKTLGTATIQGKKQLRFFVSDFTPAFEKTTELFFGLRIHLEKAAIWK